MNLFSSFLRQDQGWPPDSPKINAAPTLLLCLQRALKRPCIKHHLHEGVQPAPPCLLCSFLSGLQSQPTGLLCEPLKLLQQLESALQFGPHTPVLMGSGESCTVWLGCWWSLSSVSTAEGSVPISKPAHPALWPLSYLNAFLGIDLLWIFANSCSDYRAGVFC